MWLLIASLRGIDHQAARLDTATGSFKARAPSVSRSPERQTEGMGEWRGSERN